MTESTQIQVILDRAHLDNKDTNPTFDFSELGLRTLSDLRDLLDSEYDLDGKKEQYSFSRFDLDSDDVLGELELTQSCDDIGAVLFKMDGEVAAESDSDQEMAEEPEETSEAEPEVAVDESEVFTVRVQDCNSELALADCHANKSLDYLVEVCQSSIDELKNFRPKNFFARIPDPDAEGDQLKFVQLHTRDTHGQASTFQNCIDGTPIDRAQLSEWLDESAAFKEEFGDGDDVGLRVWHRISVMVRDVACELPPATDDNEEPFTTVKVFPMQTVAELQQKYCEVERRVAAAGVKMHRLGDDTSDEPTLVESTPTTQIWKPGVEIFHGTHVQYENGPYKVSLIDTDAVNPQPTQLDVRDHWTVKKLKQVYTDATDMTVLSSAGDDDEGTEVSSDRVLYRDQILDDNQMLVAYRLRHGAELYLEKQERMPAITYTCMNCGAKVLLKRQDVVRCRQCFFRIVLKQRTNAVCQYNCR